MTHKNGTENKRKKIEQKTGCMNIKIVHIFVLILCKKKNERKKI